MLKSLAILFVFVALSGCSIFSKEIDKAAEGAGKLVTFYCANITDETIREEFRAAVNRHASPHSVTVTCVQGGPVLRTEATVPNPSTESSP